MEHQADDELLEMLAARRGHFLLESGHHGDLWLDLEGLCTRLPHILPLCSELARSLRRFSADFICGPLVEGAFVALLVASELGAPFCYSERSVRAGVSGLFPAEYQLPRVLRGAVRGKRVAIVNDVINAGSAVRGTFEELIGCEAHVVAIGSLLTLGSAAREFADSKSVALETLTAIANTLWTPSECPLCTAGVPLQDIGGFRDSFGSFAQTSEQFPRQEPC
jgi:orotate phosphoribosyltransferase